ncbi:5-formyltetrahydrofolate cyclo-ligase [Xylella taiwanensis]|uniref:5-formyltetrahydrofolate cyclo-ligase n=1 Tax=Xylella taiwanensis TaxID=1444770 RepID=Z9JL44_9GAMM|nr:5-formyltetrahydrofolate cyclo-ligase [Xylella taiwanensis]AXI83369.1 5-formyltetrahydrofolate cyclo-ligase [Xylella taiwanensis]EWS79115.1 5-formyltetrahydrofolate cyclo-ligase [Xylella taiwanensis]MCD8456435.1 5-formyltetrahydrofolate cyclo-ligase [Xylella taiwanensis]MCD8458842.1 5-formyltetrahydrofolate cyclo-ligase [Xylella taiwanensis]MCD8460979.1 5-formyltetrahydrofolate cyclo-ligase [Xylella taiwanensis]
MTDNRSTLRQQIRTHRRAIDKHARLAAAEALAERLLTLPFAPQSGAVAGYLAMDGEITLHRWKMRLPAQVRYCLPILVGKTLRFAPWHPGQPLKPNRYGIPEPDVAPDDTLTPETMVLVVTPLVGFDAQGHRLGMGGGWYDRSFAFRDRQSPPPWLVGVGFAVQEVNALPVEAWDVPVDAICTELTTLLLSTTST